APGQEYETDSERMAPRTRATPPLLICLETARGTSAGCQPRSQSARTAASRTRWSAGTARAGSVARAASGELVSAKRRAVIASTSWRTSSSTSARGGGGGGGAVSLAARTGRCRGPLLRLFRRFLLISSHPKERVRQKRGRLP